MYLYKRDNIVLKETHLRSGRLVVKKIMICRERERYQGYWLFVNCACICKYLCSLTNRVNKDVLIISEFLIRFAKVIINQKPKILLKYSIKIIKKYL